MPLEEYRRKRDFAKTPEPPPAERAASTADGSPHAGALPGFRRRFVVQRHRATRLHYDLRLEIDGVLVSWAVPKGPTQDPATRRMAIHVEDHPLEYFDFEGVIPARQYGAGDVIVWDWGTWEPEAETPDPGPAVEAGELKFRAHGTKMKGRFTIVRTSRRPGSAPRTAFEDDEGEQWLLIKKRDAGCPDGLGRRGPSRERQVRPDQRPGQGERPRDLGDRGPGRERGDRPHGRPRRPDAALPGADEGHAGRASRSATRTGCSRSSGTATASRRSSVTASSACSRATATTPRRTSRAC